MLRACSIKALGVVLLATAVMVYVVLLLVVSSVHYSRGIHQSLVRTYAMHAVLSTYTPYQWMVLPHTQMLCMLLRYTQYVVT